jgi:hypothetical protein
VDEIGRDSAQLSVLILPDIAVLSEGQCAAIRKFVAGGGALIATGASSLYDEAGTARPDYALADLFGAHFMGSAATLKAAALQSQHTYLRIEPGLRAHLASPAFEGTEILPFGGSVAALRLDPDAVAPLTFIPPFPVLPPETAWMRTAKTDIPGLVVKGRVMFLPADIDRRYNREPLPDYANLLAHLVRRAANGNIPFELRGAGLFDCSLYTQPGRVIAHLVNLTATGRMPVDELIPVGPLNFRVKMPTGMRPTRAGLLVSGGHLKPVTAGGWASLNVPSVLDHEVVVID